MRTVRDPQTPDLFELPIPRTPLPGALAVGPSLRALLSELLKRSPLSRHDVAARMSELIGSEISKHQLDAWTAESRDGWRFPLEYLPALEQTLNTVEVTVWIADLRGCRVLAGKEVIDAEIGKMERLRDEAAKKIRQLKAMIGERA